MAPCWGETAARLPCHISQDAGEVTSPQEGPTETATECASGEEVIPLGAVVPRNTAATTGTPLLDGGRPRSGSPRRSAIIP
ncbi:unnamed protein product [Boreogadus saida]